MKIHTVKSNAKRAARQLADKFGCVIEMEPQAVDGGFHATVRIIPDVLPSSIAPEVVAAAVVLGLPPLWKQRAGELVKLPPIEPVNEHRLDSAAYAASAAGVKPPKAGGRVEQVFAMLRRPEGATVAQVAEACGWLPHTTRAFISVSARKAGLVVTTEKTEAGRVYRIPAAE